MELIRRRGDADEAERLEAWLGSVVEQFGERILALDADAAQVWSRLRVPNPDHALDKQIAAIALVNDLTLATRNVADFEGWGQAEKSLPIRPGRRIGSNVCDGDPDPQRGQGVNRAVYDVSRKPPAAIEWERGSRDGSATAPKIRTNVLRKTESVLPWFS